jgi:LysM repeat protein
LGSPANIPIKRLLPIAAVPVAVAGLAAAAFTLGNSPGGTSAVADATVHHSAATAVTSHAAASATQADVTRLAAIAPKGKHHRTGPATYVIKPGDTLASIAQRHYHSSDYWPVLYWANHGKIKYANEISAGQVLTLPAKPAKIPAAPKVLAPAPPPSMAPAPAPTTSTASYGQGYSPASATQAAPAQPVQQQSASTYSGSSGSFQSCVIAAESGGNSQVMNSSGHYGLYQFSASTWAAYGGNPGSFGNASVAEQNQVFNNAIAAGGQSNWAPYDGC